MKNLAQNMHSVTVATTTVISNTFVVQNVINDGATTFNRSDMLPLTKPLCVSQTTSPSPSGRCGENADFFFPSSHSWTAAVRSLSSLGSLEPSQRTWHKIGVIEYLFQYPVY